MSLAGCVTSSLTLVVSCATNNGMSNTIFANLLEQRGVRRIDLARALGVDKSLVTRWAQKCVPPGRMAAVSKVLGVPVEQIRPDLFPAKEAANG